MPERAWWTLKPCGTPAAYRRHLRNKEPVDEACRKAEALRRAVSREKQAALAAEGQRGA